jgi:glutathione synthase
MDVYQLLWTVQSTTPFVNDIEALLLKNNKNVLGALACATNLIQTNVDSRYEELCELFDMSDHDWVVKPSNFGVGGDVFLVRKGDSNARVLLQSATGNAQIHAAMMESSLMGLTRRYCIFQRFEPSAQKSEKRIVTAGDVPFAHYRKVAAPGDHRGNYMHGAKEEMCEISPEEEELSASIAKTLARQGVRFAAIDMVYPYILEINILNPGGAQPILEISGKDVSDRGVDLLFQYFEKELWRRQAVGKRKARPEG